MTWDYAGLLGNLCTLYLQSSAGELSGSFAGMFMLLLYMLYIHVLYIHICYIHIYVVYAYISKSWRYIRSKSFLNLVNSNQIWIQIAVFLLIYNRLPFGVKYIGKKVITIQIWFQLTRFRKDSSLYIPSIGAPFV